MKVWLLYLSGILIACSTYAQNIVWNRHNIDSAVLSWHLTNIHDADDLADTLTSIFTNDSEKVRAIYFWITQYIKYDDEKANENYDIKMEVSHDMDKEEWQLRNKAIRHTLASKKGVCEDYAQLFEYMCTYEKINCKTISGYGASLCPNWLMALDMGNADHAWNAVMINKQWFLLDLTWASGGFIGKTYHRQRNDFYYLTPPKDFIKDHFPEDSQWQLLDPPIDKKAFLVLNKQKKESK